MGKERAPRYEERETYIGREHHVTKRERERERERNGKIAPRY